MWLTSPWKCPNNGKSTRRREKEKRLAPNLTMWHSAWVKRVRISPAREHSLRFISDTVRVRFCIVQWAVLLRPASAAPWVHYRAHSERGERIGPFKKVSANARLFAWCWIWELGGKNVHVSWTVNHVRPRHFSDSLGTEESKKKMFILSSLLRLWKKGRSTMLRSQFFTPWVNVYFSSLSLL